jgi:exoribonuclease R
VECCALSFGIEIDNDTGAPVGELEVVASRILPTYSLTYDEADELINMGPDFEPELCRLQARHATFAVNNKNTFTDTSSFLFERGPQSDVEFLGTRFQVNQGPDSDSPWPY